MRRKVQRTLSCFELTVPSNARAPVPHYHKDVDEVIYGLEGTFTMTVDDEKHEVRPGDSLFVGRGHIHHFTNTSPATARVLVVLNPGSIGRKYLEEIAQEINVPRKTRPGQGGGDHASSRTRSSLTDHLLGHDAPNKKGGPQAAFSHHQPLNTQPRTKLYDALASPAHPQSQSHNPHT